VFIQWCSRVVDDFVERITYKFPCTLLKEAVEFADAAEPA
jgi:hypothetical protein